MKKLVCSALALACVWSMPPIQAQNAAPNTPASAIYIPDADMQAKLKEIIATKLQDEPVRIVNMNGESNLGVYLIHLNPNTAKQPITLTTHDDVSEVYYVIKGEGMLYHGGTIENATARASDRTGPGTGGTGKGTLSQKVGPGDVFIVPAKTPHQVNVDAKTEMVYIVVRLDPKKHLKLK